MIRVCVIGNSHVGSIKKAWELISGEFPSVTLVFFAHRSDGLYGLRVNGNTLVSEYQSLRKAMQFTSGGYDQIDPELFDVLLLYGLGARPYFYSHAYFSQQVLNASLNDTVEGTLSFWVLNLLRCITNKAVYIGHDPLAGADKVEGTGNKGFYIKGTEMLNHSVYEPLQSEMILQPESTIVNSRYTDISFAKSSVRLAIGDRRDNQPHPEWEVNHMNAAFGQLWLRDFFERLGC